MGYCMTQGETSFHIRSKNFPAALKALKVLNGKFDLEDGGETLPKFLERNKWHLQINTGFTHKGAPPVGDAVHIDFQGEKLHDDAELFRALGPYVEAGSYIEMEGEDGYIWSWQFDGHKMTEVGGVKDFDNCTEIVQALLAQKKLLPALLGIHPDLDRMIEGKLK